MKRFCALLLCLLLACPAALAARKPEPSPTPAPDHTVQLAAIDRLLADHPQSCDITAYSLTGQELTDLLAAHPDVSFTYNVTLYGLTFPGDATTIDFEGVTIQDVTELKEGLSLFPRLEYALMYDSPIAREDMDALAAMCYMSRSTFFRRFKSEVGLSPAAYHMRLRLGKSRDLLSSGLYTVEQVAAVMGFYDAAHFCRLFKRETGELPSRFRPA